MASISLELALPSSLQSVALTDPAGLTATLASIFSTTEPTWLANLPSQVQTYFESQFNAKYNTTFFTTLLTASATPSGSSNLPGTGAPGLSAGQAAGIGVGVGIGTILLIVGAYLVYRRLATRQSANHSSTPGERRDQEKSPVRDETAQRMSGYKSELPVPSGSLTRDEPSQVQPVELEAAPSSPHLSEMEGTMRPLSELSSYQETDSPGQGRFELGVYRSTRAAPS